MYCNHKLTKKNQTNKQTIIRQKVPCVHTVLTNFNLLLCHISLCYNFSKQTFPLGVWICYSVFPRTSDQFRIFAFLKSTNWLEFSTCDVMGTEQMFGKFEIPFSRTLFCTSLIGKSLVVVSVFKAIRGAQSSD